jgi:hypothetical protein
MNGVKNIWNILARLVAVFAANGLEVIGAGAVAGIPVVKAITIAGITAVATVVVKLAKSFLDDGKWSADEINSSFSTTDKNAKTVEDDAVDKRRAKSKA